MRCCGAYTGQWFSSISAKDILLAGRIGRVVWQCGAIIITLDRHVAVPVDPDLAN